MTSAVMISCNKSFFFFLAVTIFCSFELFNSVLLLYLSSPLTSFKNSLSLSLLLTSHSQTHPHRHAHTDTHSFISSRSSFMALMQSENVSAFSVRLTVFFPPLHLKEGKCLCVCHFSLTLSRAAVENTHTLALTHR